MTKNNWLNSAARFSQLDTNLVQSHRRTNPDARKALLDRETHFQVAR